MNNQRKLIVIILIISSLFGYLEWGKSNHVFLYEAEFEILKKILTDIYSVAHPFTILPLLGQLILIITLFQKKNYPIFTNIGILCIGLLILFMFLIGLIGFHLKILISTLPFIISTLIYFINLKKWKDYEANS
ncbi:MAG: hypothetical protein IT237_11735 [Bacteroidia bacterium]|nr:hypothetical protein [Bacteroidia bacterium]